MPTQLPSGMWRSQVFIGYDDKGKRKYKSFIAESKDAAQLKALQFSTTLQREKVNTLTLKRAIADYIKIKTPVLSPTTIRGYTSYRNTLAEKCPDVIRKRMYDIDTKVLQHMVNVLSDDLAAKTVRNITHFVCAVVSYSGYRVDLPTLPKLSRPELNIPDSDTIQKLYDAVKGTDLELPILLAALGPMRRGEIVAASADDLVGDILYVHRAAVLDTNGKQRIKEYPKTDESNRYIPLPGSVADMLRKQGCATKLQLNSLSDRFHDFLIKHDFEPFRFHDFRHAFVSIAHAAGIPDAYIMARGGWSTPYTMNHVYRHALNKDKLEMDKKINGLFKDVFKI